MARPSIFPAGGYFIYSGRLPSFTADSQLQNELQEENATLYRAFGSLHEIS
jgi:hypothetical protein